MKTIFAETQIVNSGPTDDQNMKLEFMKSRQGKNKNLGIKFRQILRLVAKGEFSENQHLVPTNYNQNIKDLLVDPKDQDFRNMMRRSHAAGFKNLRCFMKCKQTFSTILDYKMHLAHDHNLRKFHQYNSYHGLPWCERCGKIFDSHEGIG